MRLLTCLTLIALFCTPFTIAQRRFAEGTVPPPKFADPQRKEKLAAALPEIEKLFLAYVQRANMPGAVMGVIIDGELEWVKATGVRETTNKSPVTPDTVFRIASMTKSFTAMAILKLRDDGKLSLDDPVSRYIPAMADLPYPTKDSPAITIRHLLTHSEGFPEDNPWGDRQLAQTDETVRAWIACRYSFFNAAGNGIRVFKLRIRNSRPDRYARFRQRLCGLRARQHPAPPRHELLHVRHVGRAARAHRTRLSL